MIASRRAFIAGASCVALLTATPALAQVVPVNFATGNIVTDIAAAANDNVGMARTIGGRLAVAAGKAAATGASSSLWSKILGRSPVGRLVNVASLGFIAYDLFLAEDGVFADGDVDVPGSPAPTDDQEGPSGVTTPDFDAMPMHSAIRADSGGNGIWLYIKAWVDMGLPYANNLVEVEADGYTLLWSVYKDYPATQVEKNGKTYRVGIYGARINDSPAKWRYRPSSNPSQLPGSTVKGKATVPNAIPADANVSRARIAEVVNAAIAEALANDPALAAEVGPNPRLLTEEDIAKVLPEGETAGKVDNAKRPLTPPRVDPFTGNDLGTGTSGGGGSGSGGSDGSGGSSGLDWGEVPVVPVPDGPPEIEIPKPDPVPGRAGTNVCPSIGPKRVTSHCAPLMTAKPFLTNFTRLAGLIATGRLILKD